MTDEAEHPRGWCLECEWHWTGDEERKECPHCGKELTPWNRLTKAQQISLRAQFWFRNLRRKGLHGFSPGGAAQRLRCDRSMVDKLAEMGVLEKSSYDRDGIRMIFISERSINRAMESKRRTGKWTRPEAL